MEELEASGKEKNDGGSGSEFDDECEVVGECESDGHESEIEEISTEQLHSLPAEEQLARFQNLYSPEFVEQARNEYEKRKEELGKLNLPYWHSER